MALNRAHLKAHAVARFDTMSIRRNPRRNFWRQGGARKRLGAGQVFGQVQSTPATLSQPALAEDLPRSISCHRDGTNAKDIETCMSRFTAGAEMIDVSRTIAGRDAIRAWALREVIPGGETFRHRRIREQGTDCNKTEVSWLSWVVHYSYWRNEAGKIFRMSLQYAD